MHPTTTALAGLFLICSVVLAQSSTSNSCAKDSDCPMVAQCCPSSGASSGRVCQIECAEMVNSRQRRSFRLALGRIIKNLADVYKKRRIGEVTRTGVRIVTRNGGYQQAEKDFWKHVEGAEIRSLRRFKGGQVAIDKDGSRLIVRERSTDGRATLEFQNAEGNSIIKYRYNDT